MCFYFMMLSYSWAKNAFEPKSYCHFGSIIRFITSILLSFDLFSTYTDSECLVYDMFAYCDVMIWKL